MLDGIDVHISPGEVVGLVGPSGAGKTTFASLLPRFYDVSSGTLRMDGVDVGDASLHDVRKNIAFVSRRPRALPRHHHGKHPAGAAGRHG